jgi:hypothetical protein
MNVRNMEMLEDAGKPTGLMADVDMGNDVILSVVRKWSDPQWYLWDVVLAWDRWGEHPDNFKSVGIETYAMKDGEDQFPIYHDTPLGKALHNAVLESRLAPAIWQDEPTPATL